MTRALLALTVLVVAATLGAAAARGTSPPPRAGDVEVVVELGGLPLAYAAGRRSEQRIATEQRRFLRALHVSVPRAEVRWRYRVVANGVSVVLPRSEVRRLRTLPGVDHVTEGGSYRGLAGPDASTIRARGLPGAPLGATGQGIKIGFIDDGIDQTHPFFDPAGYTMPDGFPKGQTAYTTAKVIVARAFPPPGATWKNAGLPFDPQQSEHATHVAGIAAGNAATLAQGSRIEGIAPRAYIGNYKALTVPTDADVGLDGNAPEIVKAIDQAVEDGMDVINLSIGEPEIEPSRDLVARALDAAAAAGVVPVVAAGNDFTEYGRGSLTSPGSAANAITVGATSSGTAPAMAPFSSSGPTPLSLRLKPDVVAPGVDVLSSVPDGGWGTKSGTSMATPHVSGAVALLLERHPDWSPAQVKAALTATARPIGAGPARLGPTRSGSGLVDVAAADTPFVRPVPTAVSFGLVGQGATSHASVAIEDAGGGAGTWSVAFEPAPGAPSGATVVVPSAFVVPGALDVALHAGATDGEVSGWVVLGRDGITRRIPVWGRVATPRLATVGIPTLLRPGVYSGDTRGRPSRVTTYRYPEIPAGGAVTSRLAGPEQVFRIVLKRSVANFGVVITSRAAGSRVEPRVVLSGDENRLTGYTALPVNLNPYVDEFGGRTLVAGAIQPRAGTYDVVFDSGARSGAGRFRFRYWVNDVTPPSARLVTRSVRRGMPLLVRVGDAGSGVDPRSLEATLDGRTVLASLRGGEVRIATLGIRPGSRLLRLQLSDYQETRNMENVARILPNTRVVSVRVTVR